LLKNNVMQMMTLHLKNVHLPNAVKMKLKMNVSKKAPNILIQMKKIPQLMKDQMMKKMPLLKIIGTKVN